MDSASVSRFTRALRKIEAVLISAWTTALTYVGATEDASLWWRTVFERRVLKGEVGISVQWFPSKKMDVLWEMESLVKSLSQENQGSAESVSKKSDSPKKPSTFSQTCTEQDISLNNHWFTDRSTDVNFHSKNSKQHVRRGNIEQNENSGAYSKHTNRASKHYCHVDETLYDSSRSFTDAARNKTSKEGTCVHLTKGINTFQELAIQVRKSQLAPSSWVDDIRPERCASWPGNLCSSHHSSTLSQDNDPCKLTCTTSLPCVFSEEKVFENVYSPKLRKAKSTSIADNKLLNWEENLADTRHCFYNHIKEEDFKQTDSYLYINKGLDELLLHKDDLDLLWEGNVAQQKEMFGSNKYETNENHNYVRDNCAERDGNNPSKVNATLKICKNTSSSSKPSLGFLYYPRTVSSFKKPSLSEQDTHKHTNPRNTEMLKKGKISHDVYIGNEQDEYVCGLNWNALVGDAASDSDEEHAATDFHGGPSHPSSILWNTDANAASPSRVIIPTTAPASGFGSSLNYGDDQDAHREGLVKDVKKSMEETDKVKSTEASLLRNEKNLATYLTYADRSTEKTLKRSKQVDSIQSPKMDTAETGDLVISDTRSWLSKSVPISLNWVQQRWNELFKDMLRRASSDCSQPTITTQGKSWTSDMKYYLTGRSGYLYYKLLSMTDAKYKIVKMQAERNYFMQLYKWKLDSLTDIIKIAKDYYSDPTEMNLAHWNLLKSNLSKEYQNFADIRMQVQRIPDYWPLFTIALVLFGFSDAGLVQRNRVSNDIPTFLGTESILFSVESNVWLGPPIKSFIDAGAVLASCMRPQERRKTSTTKHEYRAMNEQNREYFGCCEMASHFDRAGTTTKAECNELTLNLGKWTRGVWCSERSVNEISLDRVIKPCCTGRSGECSMISPEHCYNLAGVFHLGLDHCVQVNCLIAVCKLVDSLADDTPWMPGPNTQWQWWRYLTAIPLTYGIFHIFTLTFVQLFVMLPLEMCVGWHRVIIIYVSSAVAGEMVANTVEPDAPHVGSTSGVAGILGVAVLELFQAWNFLQYPLLETIKLLSIIVFISFLGTWPFISVTSFLTGLITGAILGFVVIPYITFGVGRGYFRARLVLFGFILIILAVVFLRWCLPFLETCELCRYMECVPHGHVFTSGV